MTISDYLQKNTKTHLIFDLDETLMYLKIDWSTFRKGVWETVSVFDPLLVKEIPFAPGNSIVMINEAIRKHGKSAKTALDRFVEQYESEHYHGYIPNTQLISFIRKSHQKYTLFLWTNNCRKVAIGALEQELSLSLFKTIVTRDDAMLLKPMPDGFSLIYDQSVPKSDYLMVGDSLFDKQASERSGIDFFPVEHFR